ncbi:MAG: hypothetical protein JNL70_19945 [Saprospiraceae bacterium]|nr:hypothetical protein [Saprospiraceae bacterium]
MKNLTFAYLLFVAFTAASCSVTSSTRIKSKESFVLGNNEHGSFVVRMKNTSLSNLSYYEAPISGGTHSPQTIKPNQSAVIKVDKNTALVIDNKTNILATVKLKITGDVGLSMGYKQ